MRAEQSIKNSIVSLIIQVGTLLLSFVSRTVLIKTLGEEYLGINGLFSNILSMLSLAELGVGSALIYLMYKPMAENDEHKLSILMSVYAKVYNIIGLIILVVGLALVPFLDFFMKETPDIEHITLIYILYVINMSVSYFFVYKNSIINVAQKNYIVNMIKFICTVIQNIFQIIILLLFKNYIIYYSCTIVFTLIGNVWVSNKADRMFPFIKVRSKERLLPQEKKSIIKNISAMFLHKIGYFMVFCTDNLIISKFVGVVQVGLYSNYTMITSAVNTFISLIYSSITASVGNLVSSESKSKSYSVFKDIYFASSWLNGFCAICLYVLLNPFITIWIGEKYTFSNSIVLFIVINFYLTNMRRTANIFKETAGLFWNDRYKPIIESIVNLVFSLILVYKIGILGVFIGTTISTVTVCLWVEPYVLFKHLYGKSVLEYFKLFFKYFFITIASLGIILLITSTFNEVTLLNFIFRIFLCIIIPNAIFLILFHKNEEFVYFKNIILKIVHRKKIK